MCFNDHRSHSAAQPPPAPPPSPQAARRTRSKTRKPRFLSLGRQLLLPGSPTRMSSADTNDCRQLDHFTLQLDKDPHVASLLQPDGDPETDQPSLAAILGSSNPSSTSSSCSSSTAQAPPSTPSSGISWENHEDGEGLARRALRGRERWVFCKYSAEDATGSSCAGIDLWSATSCRALSLKLDYEEILAAWSDRGSLYIDGEGSGMVLPELDVDGESGSPVVFIEVGSGVRGGGWSKAEEDCGGREERVRRYKEKRRSRLFAKRIRYEVRKLNAEKRPRVKGRFVKRRDDL